MNRLIALCAALLLPGCAAFQQPAAFAPERYAGETELQRLLARVNLEANRAQPCALLSPCQSDLPTRAELARSTFLDCKGYVMSKAYALEDAGIDGSRMRVARVEVMGRPHAVLVVDGRYVLDNLDANVRRLGDYERFSPVLAALPLRSRYSAIQP
jgi:predicted transglutaminase-like cysteine proteinase